jgi:hypothetical protein
MWPWGDHILFWGMNLAVAAFTVALLLNATGAFAIITPVLGLSLLVGIVAHTLRMWAGSPTVADTAPAVAPS